MPNPTTYQQFTDQELLQLYQTQKDQNLLGVLLQRYTLLLLGVCIKYLKNEELAKDAVQQVFVKAIIEIPKYPITYFKSWIYMVAKNYCLMYLRDNKKHFATELKDQHTIVKDDTTEQEQKQQTEQLLQLIESGLQTLNPEQQTCITLFYIQKKSYGQITQLTNFTLMQVKSHIQNGKRNIKLWVEKRTGNM